MISEIDKSSVVDETESAKVTTASQMAECSTELIRRPETTDGRWIPAGVQGCPAGVTLMNVGCECDDQAGQQHEQAVISLSPARGYVCASVCDLPAGCFVSRITEKV